MANRITIGPPGSKLDWDNWGKPITDAVNEHDTFIQGFGVTYIRSLAKPSDELIISDAGPRDDLTITFPMVANGVYTIDIDGVFISPVAAGLKMNMASTGSFTIEGGTFLHKPSASVDFIVINLAGNGAVTGIVSTNANQPFRYVGTVFNGATAANIRWQWQQNTANAGNTIMRKGTRAIFTRAA